MTRSAAPTAMSSAYPLAWPGTGNLERRPRHRDGPSLSSIATGPQRCRCSAPVSGQQRPDYRDPPGSRVLLGGPGHHGHIVAYPPAVDGGLLRLSSHHSKAGWWRPRDDHEQRAVVERTNPTPGAD